MQNRRIGPDGAIAREIIDTRKRVESLESRPAGDIYFQSATTRDPNTGVEIVIGQLPDGSYGIDPFVGDVTPPPVASTPIVTAQPALISVSWDGLFVADAEKPRDFLQLNVIGHKIEGGTTVSTIPVGVVRRELAAAYLNLDIIPEGESWQFSFQSEDQNGNKSAFSARSPIVTMEGIMSTKLVDDKIQELKDKDTELSNTAAQTQDSLADAQALADALLAKGQNLVINGDFDAPIVAGKPITGWPTLTLSTVVVNASAARTGTQYLRSAPTTSSALAYSNDVAAASGRTYRAEYWVKLGQTAAVTDATASVGFYFVTTKLDGTSNNAPVTDTTVSVASLTTSTWTKVTKDYTVTIPVSKIKFGPRLTGNGNVYFVDSFKVTDVTEALVAQLQADSAFANAQQAAAAAGTAQTAANSKNRNWYQATAPAGISHKDGDTWFDTDDDNRIYVWNATAGPLGTGAWVDMRDKAIAAATAAATGALASADGKNTNYYAPTAPTGITPKTGDVWFDTTNGYRLNTWDGTKWQTTQDMAYAMLETAKKGRTFTQATEPAVEFRNATTIWNDTSGTDGMMVTKYWEPTLNAGAGGWRAVADRGIKVAQDAADAKAVVIYSSSTPAASAQKPQNLWIDTTGGINIHKRWDAVNGWTVVADSRIASTVVSASAAGVSAQQAWDEAQKNRTFTGAVQPAVQFRNSTTTWIDTSLGDGLAVTKRWDTTTSAWVVVKDGAISQAQIDAALDAQAKADAAYAASINAQGYSGNPSFDDWTGTVPNQYLAFGTGPTKETTLVRRGPFAARFNCVDTTTDRGLNWNGILNHAPNLEYFTVELAFYLVSGASLSGAAVRLDWNGLTPYSSQINLKDEITNPETGKWYRIVKTLRRPANATGTWTVMDGYLMANWSSALGGSKAVKDIVFDWMNIRPSTNEEILAYLSPEDAQTKATQAKLDAIADTAPKLAAKSATFFQTAKPTGGTYLKGDIWIDTDEGNKLYVYDGSDFIVAQDTAIDKALYSTFTTDIDSTAPNKWLYTKYDKTPVASTTPQYSDIVGFAGTSATVPDGTDIVKNQGTNYIGQIRTIVNVLSSKTIAFTATHDDGGRVYVDGVSVYSANIYKASASVSFTLSAGWHVLDFLWNENSGNDGWFAVNPTISSQVDAMFAPVSLTAISSMASAAQTAANGKNQVVYSNSDASGLTSQLGQPFILGDTWYKRSLTSPFNIIGQWEFVGGATPWAPRKIDGLNIANIDAGTITVGFLSGQNIAATAIDGKIITGATIQTHNTPATGSSARGIKLTSTELMGFDGSGNKNFSLTTGGTLAVRGTIQSGSTISGATLSASGIYTNATPQRGVQIKDTGINAWDASGVPTFILDAATGQVEVPGLKASSITGDMIMANTIGVSSLMVSDLTNFAPSLAESPKDWTLSGGMLIVTTSLDSSGKRLEATDNAATAWARGPFMAVQPGESLYATATSYRGPSATGTMYLRYEWYDKAKVPLTTPVYTGAPQSSASNGGTKFELVAVVPTGAAYTRITLPIGGGAVGSNGFYNISGRRMNGGELIVDGAIDGKTITGALIQTTSSPVSGSSARGIKLTPTELAGFDGAGNKNFSLSSAGDLTLIGDIQSGSTITGATINGTGIQTSTLPTKGIKIASTGVSAYNSTNGLTFKVDAATGVVEAPGLKSNSIVGDMIAAGTIGADKISVSDFRNLATVNERTGVMATYPSGETKVTSGFLDMVSPTQLYMMFTEKRGPVPFNANDEIYFEFTAKATAATTCNFSVWTYDAPTGGTSSVTSKSVTIPATATPVTGVIAVTTYKTDASYFLIGLSSVASKGIQVKDVKVYRRDGGELLVDGAITTNHMKSGTIDAGILSAASITSDLIASDAITAKVISVGDFTNIATGGGFDTTGDKANWSALPVNTNWSTTSPAPGSLGYVTANANTGSRSLTLLNKPSVQPGDEYYISLLYKTSSDYNGTANNSKFRVGDQNNSHLLSLSYTTISSSWIPATANYVVPDTGVNALTLTLNFDNTVGSVSVDNVVMRKKASSTLIEDDAITTDHIRAGAIDATKLSANAVTASAISGKSITADKLIISSSNNLIIEPDFELGAISWETSGTNKAYRSAGGRAGGDAIRFTGTTSTQSSYNLTSKVGTVVTNKVSVDDDNRFRGSIWVKSNVALSSDKIRLGLRYTTSVSPLVTGTATIANNSSSSTAANYLPANSWTQLSGISAVLPANTVYVEFYLSATLPSTTATIDIDAVSVTRAMDGNLVVDGQITASKLETNMVLATTIIAGDPNGIHASMEPAGFKVYAPDPGGGPAKEVVRLGVAATDDYFAITKSTGDLAASISAEGVMYALDLNASRALFYKGDELQTLLDDKPRGVVAAAYRDTSSAINGGTTNGDIPYLRLEAFMEVGRVYKISTSPMRISRDAGASVTVGIKYNSTGNATTPALATVSSGNLTQSIVWDEANAPMLNELFALTTGSSRWVSFLIWLGAVGGNAGFRPASGYPVRLIIEDVGPNRNTIGSGVSVDGNATPPPAKNTYTKQYYALGSSNYKGDGTVYSYDSGRMYQGLSPAGVGNTKSLAYFPSMTGDLSGAIVNNIRVYFMFDHWYYNSGGTARITLHGQSGLPATFPTTYGSPAVSSSGWPKPGDRWVTIPTSYYGGFVNGTYKGVALEGDGTYNTYGIAQRPVIEISYTK